MGGHWAMVGEFQSGTDKLVTTIDRLFGAVAKHQLSNCVTVTGWKSKTGSSTGWMKLPLKDVSIVGVFKCDVGMSLAVKVRCRRILNLKLKLQFSHILKAHLDSYHILHAKSMVQSSSYWVGQFGPLRSYAVHLRLTLAVRVCTDVSLTSTGTGWCLKMAEDADIKRLRNKRGCYKGAITRVETFVNSAAYNEASEIMLQERRNKLLCAFKDYEEVNSDILFLDPNDIEDISSVEDKYFNVLAKLNHSLKDLKEKDTTKPVLDNSSSKLPTIDIPTFNGKDFTKFKSFMDLFDALIDKNKSLTDVQKLFYLRKYLTEDALSVIINLPVVNESYTEALTLLKKRYENKSRLISNHINVILELPVIQKGTASALRSLISDVQQQLHALKNLGEKVDEWDRLLISILTKKLDSYTNRAYHLDRVDLDKLPTMNEFISFLERRAKALEDSSPTVHSENVQKPTHSKAPNVKATYVASNNSRKALCSFCEKQSHPIFVCPKFKLAPLEGRLKFIEDENRCQVCLNSHPGIKCKFAFKCRECKQKSHNTLLHRDEKPIEGVALCSNQSDNKRQLPTVKVKLIDKYGREVYCKALLDSCSEGCFIKKSMVDKLKLDVFDKNTTVIGIGNKPSQMNSAVDVSVYSCTHDVKFDVNCQVVEDVTSQMPHEYFDISKLDIPEDLVLADVNFNVPSEISILLDAKVYFQSLLNGLIKLKCGLVLQSTLFGYIVGGARECQQPHNDDGNIISSNFVMCQNENQLDNIMDRFWLSEKMPEEPVKASSDFEEAELSFQSSVVLENNKFSVDMPLVKPAEELEIGDSFSVALQLDFNEDNVVKTLGLKYDIISDKFTFVCPPFDENDLNTKRKILSFIGRMFDPLGLITPIIMSFKIYMQKLYALKVDWDSIVPTQELVEFKKLLSCLKDMQTIEVPRYVTSAEVLSVQVVGYADASFRGFGCCLYLRSFCKDGTVKVELLCAKSRVSPLSRSHTIPQLELNSALLLAQLASKVRDSLKDLVFEHQAFQSTSPLEEEILPTNVDTNVDLTSNQLCSNFCKIADGFNIFDRYSDFNILQTQIAYILRFRNNARKDTIKNTGPLSPQEYSEALKVIIRYNQSKFFSAEITAISNNKPIKSPISSLHPYLDSEQILRVGGRLSNAPNISYDKMHPVILPKSSHITKMMIEKEHKRLLHAGAKLLLSSLSQKYWIVSGLREVKKVLRSLGDLVLVKLSNVAPMKWPMGRIVKVLPGPDGKIRVAHVQMNDKVYVRSYRTLCPLPLGSD
ncbi:pao retrotransposon peptidase domain-containing protein [Phthorimaea operculella]|nr:pao retrotransposon peptidase domain-containing protein [Phthorimaea operculella]